MTKNTNNSNGNSFIKAVGMAFLIGAALISDIPITDTESDKYTYSKVLDYLYSDECKINSWYGHQIIDALKKDKSSDYYRTVMTILKSNNRSDYFKLADIQDISRRM